MRHARAIPLARRRLNTFVLDLKSKPTDEWPPHLRLAWNILNSGSELALSEQAVLSLIIKSVSAAHKCAQAINEKSADIAEFQTRIKLHDTLRRIAKCTKRAPAGLRRRLDEQVAPLRRESAIDLEVIDAIFDIAVAAFREFPKAEPSRTALREMCGMPPDHDRVVVIKSEYAAVGEAYQRKAEDAIATLAKSASHKASAADVFNALASALRFDRTAHPNAQIPPLIVEYVAELATFWRQAGLRPTRATRVGDPTYRSKFHRFVDLVLTAMTEPSAQRHLINLDDLNDTRREIWLVHSRLPEEARRIVSPAPRRADVNWLISEDHVKKALRIRVKKTDPDTP